MKYSNTFLNLKPAQNLSATGHWSNSYPVLFMTHTLLWEFAASVCVCVCVCVWGGGACLCGLWGHKLV